GVSSCNSANTEDKGSLCRLCKADAGRIRVAASAHVANVDVSTACGKIATCASANCDVAAARNVVVERQITDGRVAVALRVGSQRTISSGCVKGANRVA